MWLYDNYEWWASAVHSAACPAASIEWGSLSEIPAQVGIPAPQEIEESYTAGLNALRRDDLSSTTAATILFCRKALRKWRLADPHTRRDRSEAAIRGFVIRNASSHLTDPIPFPYDRWMREVLREWLPEPSEEDEAACKGRFGPGAVAERMNHCKRFLALHKWAARSWGPSGLYPCNTRLVGHQCARLCAVPKTMTKDRLITVEPCFSSYGQQLARQLILRSIHHGPLAGTTMDLGYVDGQAQQRRLALRASKDKRLATLDLSDASDRIGWTHVQQVFPGWVVRLLETYRSSEFEVPAGYSVASSVEEGAARFTGCGGKYPTRLYAGMGNATTFAVETLFFAAFVYAYARAHGLSTFVRVFGDDIICTSQWAAHFNESGLSDDFPFFVVNRLKSFWGVDGLRESCGVFAYNGVDITVPKIDGYQDSWEGRVALCDVHRSMYYHWLPAVRRLANMVAMASTEVPLWPFVVEGFPSFYDEVAGGMRGYDMLPKTRMNPSIQRREAWVMVNHPRYRTFSLDWVRARKRNDPPPQDFLEAVLLGLAGSNQLSLTRRPSFGPTSVRFPKESESDRAMAWRPVGSPART